MAMAQALTNPPEQFGYAAMVKPGSYVETYMDVAQWVIASGGSFARDGAPTLNDPSNVEAIANFKAMFDAGVMPRDVDKSTYRQMWWQGKVAVLFDGSWMMGFARQEAPEITSKLATALMPWPGHLTASAFQIWSIPRGAANPEAAFSSSSSCRARNGRWKWCRSPTPCHRASGACRKAIWVTTRGSLPSRKPSDKYAVSIMPEGLEAYGNEILKIIADKIEEILYRDAPIEASLNEAQAEVEELIGG